MIRLVDYRIEKDVEVEEGTCDYCMSVTCYDIGQYIFENDEKEQISVENGRFYKWEYDNNAYAVENIIDFAHFIKEQNVQTFDELDLAKIHKAYRKMLKAKK